MNSSVMLLFPILVPTVCGIIAGTVPAFRKDETRRLLVLAALLATLCITDRRDVDDERGLFP